LSVKKFVTGKGISKQKEDGYKFEDTRQAKRLDL